MSNAVDTPNAANDSQRQMGGRAYVLMILTLVYAFNHIDRQVLVILLEPIKQDLNLNDTQLGLLSGLGFAVFYATLGIPIAMWADRGVRRNILALALAIWSGMTVLSGLAQNYTHLLLARMGVGIGEAGGTPPSTSMIADLYPPEDRATALGVYTFGIGLGILIGFPLGGFVAEAYGWRAAFFVAGAPGLLLALIVRLTIKEPVRGLSEQRSDTGKAPSFNETLSFIFSQPALLWLLLGCTLICISANGFLAWTAPFLIRSFGEGVSPFAANLGITAQLQEISIVLGLLVGGLGGLGAVVLGRICDNLSRQDTAWRPRMILLSGLVSLPFVWLFLNASSREMAYLANMVPSFIGLIYASIAYTAAQELVQLRMRAFTSAFTLFCLTLLGIGFGPTIVGALSDYFASKGASDGDALKTSLLWMLTLNIASLGCLFMSSLYYHEGVQRAKEADSAAN